MERLKGWMVPLLLLGTMAYCIAEEITLTTYYPSPRGVYDQLRTAGNVQIGRIEPPSGDPDNEAPRLHIVKDPPRDSFDVRPALRIDAQGAGDAAHAVVVDRDGNVGIGMASPNPDVKLDVAGGIKLGGIPTTTPQPGMVRWTGTNFEGRNATEWVRFMSMPEGSNVTMTHASGSNPPCPAGSGIPLMRKWASKTCGSQDDTWGCYPCTAASGWTTGTPPTCSYRTWGSQEGV